MFASIFIQPNGETSDATAYFVSFDIVYFEKISDYHGIYKLRQPFHESLLYL